MQGQRLFSAALVAVVVVVCLLPDSAHCGQPLNGDLQLGLSSVKRPEGAHVTIINNNIIYLAVDRACTQQEQMQRGKYVELNLMTQRISK